VASAFPLIDYQIATTTRPAGCPMPSRITEIEGGDLLSGPLTWVRGITPYTLCSTGQLSQLPFRLQFRPKKPGEARITGGGKLQGQTSREPNRNIGGLS
jgi:hypothetical protein